MTRKEHMRWCQDRAIQEMDFSGKPTDALVSMASDLRKHPETNKEGLIQLCVLEALMKPSISRQEAIHFIQGFN